MSNFKKFSNIFVCYLALILFGITFTQRSDKDDIFKLKPEFSTYMIESGLKQTFYCGSKNDITTISLTEDGSILSSTNKGITWESLDQKLFNTAKTRVDISIDEVGKVRTIIQSIHKDSTLFLLGTKGINWVTFDCGVTLKAFNQGRKLEELVFHPIDNTWIIATAFTLPDDGVNSRYKELYISKDGGISWKFLVDFVKQVSWGVNDLEEVEYGVPKSRILVTRHGDTNVDSAEETYNKLDLVYSDNFFFTMRVALDNVEKFILSNDSLYVSKWILKNNPEDNKKTKFNRNNKDINEQNIEEKTLTLLYADIKHFSYEFKPALFNHDPELVHHNYNFLKADNFIVLSVAHNFHGTSFGDLYFSDDNSRYFGHSIQHGMKQKSTNTTEFTEIAGLNGIFLINTLQLKETLNSQNNKKSNNKGSNKNKTGNEKFTFSEEELHSLNPEELLTETRISLNRGIAWHKLQAPKLDSNGNPYKNCEDQRCYLHLSEIKLDNQNVLSQKNAVGLILANGNVGTHLLRKPINEENLNSEYSLFLSRDGGLTWKEIIKRSHLFNIGDHGGVIVIALKESYTTEVLFSIDEGISFEPIRIAIDPIIIDSIQVVKNSLNFIISGKNKQNKGIIIGVDFLNSFARKCADPEMAGHILSDYEQWSPHENHNYNIKIVGYECLMGQKLTFVRRRQDRKCYNGPDFDPKTKSEKCKCLETDYQCDIGYVRSGNMSPCIKSFSHPNQEKLLADGCTKTVTRGYKKISGNKCIGGVDLNPITVSCPGENKFKSNLVIIFSCIIGLVLILLTTYYMRNVVFKPVNTYIHKKDKIPEQTKSFLSEPENIKSNSNSNITELKDKKNISSKSKQNKNKKVNVSLNDLNLSDSDSDENDLLNN